MIGDVNIVQIILQLVVVLLVILISMTLHEAMHGFVAYYLGDDTAKREGRLTLNPIKHIDPFLTLLLPMLLAFTGAPIFGGAKPVPFNPNRVRFDEWGAALVAFAGPLTNFVLGFIFFGAFVVFGQPTSGILGEILSTGIMVNLGFFIFNLVPIPPLDGSRILYALAPEFVRRGMETMEQYGIFVIFLLVMFGSSLVGSIMLGGIGFFLGLFSRIFGIGAL